MKKILASWFRNASSAHGWGDGIAGEEPQGIGTNNGRDVPVVSAVIPGAIRPSALRVSPGDDSADDGRAKDQLPTRT